MSCMDFQDAGPYQIYPLGFWGVQYATIPCVFFFFFWTGYPVSNAKTASQSSGYIRVSDLDHQVLL